MVKRCVVAGGEAGGRSKKSVKEAIAMAMARRGEGRREGGRGGAEGESEGALRREASGQVAGAGGSDCTNLICKSYEHASERRELPFLSLLWPWHWPRRAWNLTPGG